MRLNHGLRREAASALDLAVVVEDVEEDADIAKKMVEVLTEEEISRVLGACDLRTDWGARDGGGPSSTAVAP